MKTIAIALALMLAGCSRSSSDDDEDSASSDSGTVLATGSMSGTGSSLTYYGTAKAILDAGCAPCHGIPAAAGAPSTFALDRYADEGGCCGGSHHAVPNRCQSFGWIYAARGFRLFPLR